MWAYKKMLEFPINIKKPNVKMAVSILTQFGGPNGELGAALRYLSQRYSMPDDEGKALLTDIGTEELAHMEMIQTMVYQLTKDATVEQIKAEGMDGYFATYGLGVFPQDAQGVPFSASTIAVTGDFIANLYEDLAAEQKARATYESLIQLATDDDVIGPLEFLRQREVIHFQRFAELLDRYEREYGHKKNNGK